MAEMLYLSNDAVSDLAGMPEYVDAVREAYRQFGAAGQLGSEEKLFRESPDGTFMYYGAILPASGVMGTFVYWGGFGAGEAWFLTALADAETGEPLALVDSPGVNPYKTGATGGVGVDALARPDATELALVGTGPQAAYQLRAVDEVRDLRAVRAFSPTPANRSAFARRMDERFDADVTAVGTARAALEGADVVVTATTATDPVFPADALEPGTHVTAMGQSHPDRRELDAETVARGLYVPDLRQRAVETSGELRGALAAGTLDEDDVHPGLGDLLAGTAPGRTDPEQVTVFDMGGTGVETVAAAHMVVERARERGRGQRLPVTPKSDGFAPL
jgi:alanine dehydrogenase